MTLTGAAAPRQARYVLDQSWHAERERLGSLTALYDETTMRISEQLGLAAGWRCLELGAGTGSIAEAFADRVGTTGEVMALDSDIRFLAPLAGGPLAVREADVTTEPLPAGRYDLVHARLLLEHLPQREQVLRSMTAATASGGWVLVEDFDWSTAAMVDPPSPVYLRVAEACRQFMQAHGYDAAFGRRLPRALTTAGLTDVATHAASEQVFGNPDRGIPQWELLVAQLRPGLLAGGLVIEADLDEFRGLCRDPSTACFAPLMVSSWGRRAAA